MNDHIIKEIGRKARNAALEFYDGNARYGGERIVLEYKKKLERAMDLELEDLTVKNKNFKVTEYANANTKYTKVR